MCLCMCRHALESLRNSSVETLEELCLTPSRLNWTRLWERDVLDCSPLHRYLCVCVCDRGYDSVEFCWWKCGWMTSLFLCVYHKWKCNWVIKHRHNMQETTVMSTHPNCFLQTHTKLFDSWNWGILLVPNDFSLFWITPSIGKTHPTQLSDIITQRWVTHLLTYSLRGEQWNRFFLSRAAINKCMCAKE